MPPRLSVAALLGIPQRPGSASSTRARYYGASNQAVTAPTISRTSAQPFSVR